MMTTVCHLGHQRCQTINGRTSLHHRVHLDDVTNQHNVDQRCQLPEEIHHHGFRMQGVHNRGVQTVNVSHHNAHCNQRHHCRLATLQFATGAVKEWRTTVEK